MKEEMILRVTVCVDNQHVFVNNFVLDAIDIYESDIHNDSISMITFYLSSDTIFHLGKIIEVCLVNENKKFDLGIPVSYSFHCLENNKKIFDLFYETE